MQRIVCTVLKVLVKCCVRLMCFCDEPYHDAVKCMVVSVD